MTTLTQSRCLELLEYRDGDLYWKVYRGRLAEAGDHAGSPAKDGRLRLKIDGKLHLNHRIVFLMFNGYVPEYLDHIDGDCTNNRIENLRPATKSENNRNVGIRKDNTSGIKGVHWNKRDKKWQAQIQIEGKRTCLGYFDDLELADLVAIEARNKHYKEFANHGSTR